MHQAVKSGHHEIETCQLANDTVHANRAKQGAKLICLCKYANIWQ